MRSIQWWGSRGPQIDFKGGYKGSKLVKKVGKKLEKIPDFFGKMVKTHRSWPAMGMILSQDLKHI